MKFKLQIIRVELSLFLYLQSGDSIKRGSANISDFLSIDDLCKLVLIKIVVIL